MSASAPVAKYLKDYRPAPFLIDRVDLEFDILDSHTSVRARMVVKRNPKAEACDTLQLDGSAELVAVRLDGEALAPSAWTLADEVLTLPGVPESFILDIETRLEPAANTSLMGLYASNGNLYTQCEPEGFRKITYYLDRPDVMAKFSTTLIADRQRFPVLLSNGNKVGEGLTENRRRHWVKWVDPYRKPAYLFAVVAGKLSVLRDHYTTRGGRKVTLEIYVAPADMDKTAHAMSSLKKSMQWDEQVFGLEYDLDTYMIVAVGDFNMGAMENKGLNIFNTKFVLASQATALAGEPCTAAPTPVENSSPFFSSTMPQVARSTLRGSTMRSPSTSTPQEALSATVSWILIFQSLMRLSTISKQAITPSVADRISAAVRPGPIRSFFIRKAISPSALGWIRVSAGIASPSL